MGPIPASIRWSNGGCVRAGGRSRQGKLASAQPSGDEFCLLSTRRLRAEMRGEGEAASAERFAFDERRQHILARRIADQGRYPRWRIGCS